MQSIKEKKSKIQFDKWSEDYDQGAWSWYFKKSYLAAIDTIKVYLNLKDKVIVDLGCGTGELAMMLSNTQNPKQVFGVDISENMIAKAKIKKYNSKTKFICSSASSIPLKNKSADVIFLLNSLHHHHNPTETFLEFLRVLKPGGYGVILDPHRDGLHGLIWSNIIKVLFNELYVDYYSSKQISSFASEAGLSIVSQKKFLALALFTVVMKPNA
jgi:ubiquinone/menaquinone biosynthesis C-methylase UbiE